MKYVSFFVLLAASVCAGEAAIPEPKAQEQTGNAPAWNETVLREAGKTVRTIRRAARKASDFRSAEEIALEEVRAARLEKARAAGEFAAANFSGKQVIPLVFGPADDPFTVNELKTFREAAKGAEIASPVSVLVPADALPPPDDAPSPEALNEAMLKCMALGADVIVNFAGLPVRSSEAKKLIFWKWSKNDPRLILTDLPDSLLMSRKMLPCPISAVILRNPAVLTREEAEIKREEEADANTLDPRFLLFTDKNADVLTKSGTVRLAAD